MGNVVGKSSTPPNESHQIQKRRNDLDVLGQRVSFGDDELVHLYDSYDLFWQLREKEIQNGGTTLRKSSFLYDWYEAILLKDRKTTDSPETNVLSADHLTTTATSPQIENEIAEPINEKMINEQLQSIQYVIQHILPLNFDIALYKGCFTSVDDPIHSMYNFNGSIEVDTIEGNRNSLPTKVEDKEAISFQTTTADVVAETISEGMSMLNQEGKTSSNTFSLVDEFTRITRLCTFFDGLSCCNGRRSSKECIASLFRTIYMLQEYAEGGASVVLSTNQNPRISALVFVEAGYRFALALSYLQQCRHESTMNLEQFLPLCDKNDACKASIHTMAKSIVEKRVRRLNQQRSDWSDALNVSSNDTEALEGVENDWIELDDVTEWIDVVAPMFPFIMPTFFQYILFPSKDTLPKSRTFFNVPIMLGKSELATNTSILSSKTSFLSVHNFALACFTPALNGSYFPLYSSNDDGLSFNRLQNSVLGYSGPTLFIIQSESGGIFGAYTATAWKESKDFYGNTDCFLYQLWPRTVLYRPTSNERGFMYCNSAARSHGYDQQAHGIGFGGTVFSPRLFLAENFDECSASSQDLTFENGPLLPDVGTSSRMFGSSGALQRHRSLFAIECLEVWGVGGSMDLVQAALSARESNRALVADLINKARKVDKAQFLDDFRSGTISSKTFAHRQQVDGRADVDLDERVVDKDKVYSYS